MLVALALAASVAGLRVASGGGEVPARPPGERPELLLLTSLPIVFPERLTLDTVASPALSALQGRYRVTPISVADASSLAGHRLLLMAQPRAQPSEMLVELDRWVRGGGRVVVLADPALEWPTSKPLGDVTRPPFAFSDTGLLGHWGVLLEAPETFGPATLEADGKAVQTLSPGTLRATNGGCKITAGGLVARCKVGQGKAIVIADADFLAVEGRRGTARSANLGFLLGELDRLGR
jgi:hypothetical protein